MPEDPRPFPLRDFLGFDIERGEGRATATLTLDDRHRNPFGLAHGAVAFTLMDTAMGAAVVSVLPEGAQCATIEVHTRFHAGARDGGLRAEAIVTTPGRRITSTSRRRRSTTPGGWWPAPPAASPCSAPPADRQPAAEDGTGSP
ncbi:MAG: PaaI family thioesterase [Acidimicrobiales bacterium]